MTDKEKADAVRAEIQRLAAVIFPTVQRLRWIPSAAFRGSEAGDLVANFLDASAKVCDSIEAMVEYGNRWS